MKYITTDELKENIDEIIEEIATIEQPVLVESDITNIVIISEEQYNVFIERMARQFL